MKYNIITILGPTASGKTAFATHLAHSISGEIISADSRQVYKNMDIGTGKDLTDYIINDTPVPYHLIDICEAGEKYNVFAYQHDFHKAYGSIQRRGNIPILCGGSGMYIEAVLKGYHLPDVPENKQLRRSLQGKSLSELSEILRTYRPLHNTSDLDTAQRAIRAIEIAIYTKEHPLSENTQFPPLQSLTIGVDIPREERRENITHRLKKRLSEGMVDEVKTLLSKGLSPQDLIYYGLEYKYITLYLQKKLSYAEMFRQLEIAIHQFAKRQQTWFRGMERKGEQIRWIPHDMPTNEKVKLAQSWWREPLS